jgi:hypothetical protein
MGRKTVTDMRNKSVQAASLTFAIVLLGADHSDCFAAPSSSPHDLTATVSRIAKTQPDVERDQQSLLDDNEMKRLFAAPAPFFHQALDFVRDARPPVTEKLIVVYGMQCLPLEKYLTFGQAVLSSVESGVSPRSLLLAAVLPGTNWSTRLSVQYRNPHIQRFLKQVSASDASDGELRAVVARMLSGDLKRSLRRAPTGYWGTRSCSG